jgi:competence protein ComEC
MRAPALYLIGAFSVGIGIAAVRPRWGGLYAVVAAVLLLIAFAAWRRGLDFIALASALLAWVSLGALASLVVHRIEPTNRASTLSTAGRLDLGEPLRWHGTLRSDPQQLPWGWRFEVDLDQVEVGGAAMPVSGGLRLNYYGSGEAMAPTLRAGDEVEALAKAEVPHNYGDPGAFDYRAQLARQGVDLTATLRSLDLLRGIQPQRLRLFYRFARLRGHLLKQVDSLFSGQPERAAVLRAMLLGDRGFVDSEVADEFRKTSSFHVLVIAGLHVGALAGFVFWLARRLGLSALPCSLCALLALASYLMVVQDRPPVLRAALMAAAYLVAATLHRRLDLLQTAGIAALTILLVRPAEIADPSFQLSFLAVAAIGGIAVPWLARTAEPLRRALTQVGDVTRDPSHEPRLVQLRLDLRALAQKLSGDFDERWREPAVNAIALFSRAAVLLWETLVVSFVIQLGLFPLSVSEFHRVNAVTPFANIGAVLLTALIVPVGFATLAVSALWRAAGRILAEVTSLLVGALLANVKAFAHLRSADMRVPDPPVWLFVGVLAAFALLATIACLRSKAEEVRPIKVERSNTRRRPRIAHRFAEMLAAAVLCSGIFAITIHPFPPRLDHGEFETTVLDVGQGDSIFVASPGGKTLLVDGGGGSGALWISGARTRFDIGEEVVSRYLWSRGLKRLDAVALTHAHEDHLEGLNAVLENFRVAELWVGHDVDSAAYRHLLEIARARGTRVVHWKQGDSINWGEIDGHVLWPDTDEEVRQAENDDSLVLRLRLGNEFVLLTGDIERAVERRLASERAPLEAQFLKVPHHGSKTSSTDDLLALVHPRAAAISVGENNPFNHPSPEVIARLGAAGARVFRTDQDGAVTFITNGKDESVSAYSQKADNRPGSYWASLWGDFFW